ncbi:MAG: nuclear transport factor 2 family protein [Pyrinomonadaceae bacterium]
MKRLTLTALTVIVAAFFAACGAPAGNTPANSNTSNANANAAKPTAAAPTKEALMTLERSAYEAFKTKDAKFWDGFLAANFVGYGNSGKLDKAAAMKEYVGADCDIKSYALSDDKMTSLGADAAMITYKTTMDGTCGGQKVPANTWAVGVYVRDGDKWKGAFHAEAPAVDPKAPAAAAPATSAKKEETKPAEAAPDAATTALMTVEKKAWDDWKDKNAKGLDEFAAKDMVSLSATEGWTDRESSLKRWADPSCEVKAVSVTDPASVAFGSDYALLTFRSAVDGKCGGQSIPPEFGATVYIKEGGTWRALMTMGTPIG